jgi:hypothetical protein
MRRTKESNRTINMTSNLVRSVFAIGTVAALAGFPGAQTAFPQEPVANAVGAPVHPGTIVGVVRNASRAPVGGATVTATRLDNHSIRSTMSGSDGIYSFSDVVPGEYSVLSQAEGYADALVSAVTVVPGKPTTVNPSMAMPTATPAQVSKQTPPTGSAPAPHSSARSVPVSNGSTNSGGAFVKNWLKGENQTWGDLLKPDPRPGDAQQVASLTTPPVATFDRPNPDLPVPAPTPAPQAAALQTPAGAPIAPAPPPAVDTQTPFADYDWTWLNGNPRNKDTAFDSKFFTPEIRADLTYTYDFNHPSDDSMGGSSELFRSNEIQLEQLGLGGDFHLDNVRARFMTQFGMYSTATVRNDPSWSKGQWDIGDADRYLSEAYGGYHINKGHGINIDVGIFMSYVGLFSYYNFDNWAYQPSYVSSNTPWFFQGVRIQTFPTNHLKLEPWIINGWQSYGSSNSRKGLGGQIKWTPKPWLNIISNNYGLGHDDLYVPNRGRLHTDNSIEIKYYEKPESRGISKMAVSVTGDAGCEFGGGVSCHNNSGGHPKQSFIGYMVYNRLWFDKDLFGFTLGGGQINNPGRYLVLLPPINGETAGTAAINSPYFTENPGDPFKAWDLSETFDYMPKQWITFRVESDYRHASVPYWSGAGGVTPPPGTNNGYPGQYACMDGTPSATTTGCGNDGGLWTPDLKKNEWLLDIDLMVKF